MNQDQLTRRDCLKLSLVAGATTLADPAIVFRSLAADAGNPRAINIGSRRELFVDDFLIEQMSGAKLRLHKPEPRKVSLVCDAPWEGNTSAYYTILHDEDRFRAWYRGSHYDEKTQKSAHPEVVCYAESRDGIEWTKPNLGLCEFAGSKQNNIVWTGEGSHNFTPFKDGNPACPANLRYKTLARSVEKRNGRQTPRLDAYASEDGLRWRLLKEALITAGAFDSQNLAFWDAERGHYRAYWRTFNNGVRAIRTAVSDDFIHWEAPTDLAYADSRTEHLYTNAVLPYFRAPHLFLGFPTRFEPHTQQVAPLLMTSRDGVTFRRWEQELISIVAPKDRDGNRSNYMAWGLVQTPGQDRELSVYATEAYYTGPGSRLRRFTFRTDGFVSVYAPEHAEVLTKPLRFSGDTLEFNCRTSPEGSIRVGIQDIEGQPLPGFESADCHPITGDHIAHIVKWKTTDNVRPLANEPVRLRLLLENCDLFSIKFTAK